MFLCSFCISPYVYSTNFYFHVNIMHSGHACHGTWPSNETIAIVVQMARMYDYVTLYAVIVCYSRSGIFIAEPINSIG